MGVLGGGSVRTDHGDRRARHGDNSCNLEVSVHGSNMERLESRRTAK